MAYCPNCRINTQLHPHHKSLVNLIGALECVVGGITKVNTYMSELFQACQRCGGPIKYSQAENYEQYCLGLQTSRSLFLFSLPSGLFLGFATSLEVLFRLSLVFSGIVSVRGVLGFILTLGLAPVYASILSRIVPLNLRLFISNLVDSGGIGLLRGSFMTAFPIFWIIILGNFMFPKPTVSLFVKWLWGIVAVAVALTRYSRIDPEYRVRAPKR